MILESGIVTSISGVYFSMFGGGYQSNIGSQAEQSLESWRQGNSGGRPPRNPRDTYVVLCTFAGIFIGCIIGAVLGVIFLGSGGIVIGLIVGFIVGGIIGTFTGDYLKKRKNRKLDELAEKRKGNNNQGPIIR